VLLSSIAQLRWTCTDIQLLEAHEARVSVLLPRVLGKPSANLGLTLCTEQKQHVVALLQQAGQDDEAFRLQASHVLHVQLEADLLVRRFGGIPFRGSLDNRGKGSLHGEGTHILQFGARIDSGGVTGWKIVPIIARRGGPAVVNRDRNETVVRSHMSAAERIYAASISEEETASRLAYSLARRIEDDILWRALPAGGVLGSLRELSERYAVGRSVAREAFGLLERRGLGRMRPGPCGGFILAKPCAESIAEELADYFRSTSVTVHQLLDAREAVDLMAARFAAAARPGEAELARLVAASAPEEELSGHLSARAEIARLAAQPVVLLFVECLNSLTADFGPVGCPLRGAGRGSAAAMLRALRTGNVDAAVAAARRAHAELAASLIERQPSCKTHAEPAKWSSRARTLSAAIAHELAAEIVGLGSVGARLGSESDLCERFNVSRLTLRQAIRRLQDSGLVECRRGRGNGLLVRDRRAAGSIRLMLAYLIGEKMDPMAAGTILFQINCFVPVLAVRRANAEQRRNLEGALSRLESCDPFDRYDLLALVHCVSRLAESPIIDLFSRCLAAYEARFRASLAESLPASAQASYFRLLRGLLERLPSAAAVDLQRAKMQSAALMLEMSYSRPL